MILRDGKNTSLWQPEENPFQSSSIPDKRKTYDVAIAGGGITGITTGLLLAQAGLSCIIFESENLCFGTTGGTTAHLNTLLDTPYSQIRKKFDSESARLIAEATARAINRIEYHIQQFKIDCGFSWTNAYLFAREEKQLDELEEIQRASIQAGVHAVDSETIPLEIPFLKAIKAGGQAKFNPVKYVFALAKEFENNGGTIVTGCRVTGAENNHFVFINTTQGTFRAAQLIYATHIPPGINLLHLRCIPYRSYAIAFTLRKGKYPEELCYDMYDPYHYYRSQQTETGKFIIAGGYDHKTGHEENTEQRFRELIAHCQNYFDIKEIAYQWSSQYFEPADGLPYIGHLPGQPENIFVATGFGGNGMVYSHVAAELLTDMITDRDSELIALLDPNRVKPVAGFTNFIGHNADVVKQFANKFFDHEKLNELAGLATGEGKIIVYEGQKLALYRDENDSLHAVNPICTHLKCQVNWNATEKSWDCPCHGARYSIDGEVLTGPANHPLEKIETRQLSKVD